MDDMPSGSRRNPRQLRSQASITIREMELEDLAAVFALGERIFTADRWPNLYRTWDEFELIQIFGTDTETCLVAESNDQVVGFALGTLIEKRRSAWTYGYLLWLGVEPDLSRSGVGKRLVNRLTELFIAQGARIMLADTESDNLPAVNFFRRQGFSNETEHVYLAKNLTQHPEYVRRRRALSHSTSDPTPTDAAPAHLPPGGINTGEDPTAGRPHEHDD
ncbi:GNAT family N-acetyltransferase [Lujinxingia sediminis]|nr:GNAT family N-acetyltransferase [Lujinxingia sediminis]